MTLQRKFRPTSTTALPRLLSALRNLAARTLRRPPASRRLELLETLPLGGKRQLLLVACDGQSYLVGAGTDSVSAIVPAANRESSSAASGEFLHCARSGSAKEGSLLQ